MACQGSGGCQGLRKNCRFVHLARSKRRRLISVNDFPRRIERMFLGEFILRLPT
jgi:hypothetical protein